MYDTINLYVNDCVYNFNSYSFHIIIMFKNEKEHALSKDVDVALWQDSRLFNSLAPVADAGDFVIVNNQLYTMSLMTSRKQLWKRRSCSYLKMNVLLQLYLKQHPSLSQSLTHRHGQTYLRLTDTQVDGLCRWINKTRKEFDCKRTTSINTGKKINCQF